MRKGIGAVAMAALLAASGGPVCAQSAGGAAAPETISLSLLTEMPDVATVQMPDLSFTPSSAIEGDYDKYYYFHRADTSFATALADLRECDAFARGLPMRPGYSGPYIPVTSPYAGTAGGLIGGAIVGGVGLAILSADRRSARRANMRRCMHYKRYQRFGLEKSRWQAFNFEEGLSRVKEVERMLAQQAKVASTAATGQKDLGL